ncbi:MAG: YqaA family protein [Cetobacterium sp.]|uniref:YqaA family protein n=1 Tax=Cetobacterium sp. TaxID=2071632 RepID=UPI003F324DFF
MFEILKEFGIYGIAVAGLLEATILPIPMETISIPLYLSSRDKVAYLLVVLLIFSTLGSIIGYLFWRKISGPIKSRYLKAEMFIKIKKMYEKNALLALLTSAFTPIPFEGYILVAGILEIEFKTFLLGVIFSRILRHFPQGILIYFYGEKVTKDVGPYSIIIIISIVLIILIKSLIGKKIKKGNI